MAVIHPTTTYTLVTLVIGFLILPASAPRDPGFSRRRKAVRLDVMRDAWVSDVGQEADGNNGGRPGSSSRAFRR